MTLRAFHGDPAIRDKYLARLVKHREADELVQDHGYWHEHKGCAVGCTVHSSDYKAFETELGFPWILAGFEDTLFEALPSAYAKRFPEQFLRAPKINADLTRVCWQLYHWLLTESITPRIDIPLIEKEIAFSVDAIAPLCVGKPADKEKLTKALQQLTDINIPKLLDYEQTPDEAIEKTIEYRRKRSLTRMVILIASTIISFALEGAKKFDDPIWYAVESELLDEDNGMTPVMISEKLLSLMSSACE